MKPLFSFVLILLLSISAFALPSKEVPSGGIALPGQLSYMGEGIQIGLSLGMIRPLSEDDKLLAAWNGVFEYFYTSFLSAGVDVWIYGGDLDSKTMILFARYRIHSRFHYMVNSRFSLYFAPMVWFEDTSIDEIQEDISGKNEIVFSPKEEFDIYRGAPEQKGFAIAGEIGFGLRLVEGLGLVGSASIEKSFLSSSLFNVTAGFSYDIRRHSKFLQENVLGLNLSVEATLRRFIDDDWKNYSGYLLFGLNVGI